MTLQTMNIWLISMGYIEKMMFSGSKIKKTRHVQCNQVDHQVVASKPSSTLYPNHFINTMSFILNKFNTNYILSIILTEPIRN